MTVTATLVSLHDTLHWADHTALTHRRCTRISSLGHHEDREKRKQAWMRHYSSSCIRGRSFSRLFGGQKTAETRDCLDNSYGGRFPRRAHSELLALRPTSGWPQLKMRMNRWESKGCTYSSIIVYPNVSRRITKKEVCSCWFARHCWLVTMTDDPIAYYLFGAASRHHSDVTRFYFLFCCF